MTGRLLDEARAFEIIAPHLSERTRADLADAIARRILPAEQARTAPTLPGLEGRRPEYELAEHDPVVRFLVSLGYAEGELSRATGRLWSAVRADREQREVAALTELYLARLWNRITDEAKADA